MKRLSTLLTIVLCIGCAKPTPVTPPAPPIPQPDGRRPNVQSSGSVAMGQVPVNSSAKQTTTLTSTGKSPVTINAASVTGSPAFTVSGITFPLVLNPGQTATLTVTFSPTLSGPAAGTLAIASNSSAGPINIALSGTGTPVLSSLVCTPTSFSAAGNSSCVATLNAPAVVAGTVVSLSSSSASVTVPSSVTVAGGQSTATFSANVAAVTAVQTVTITGAIGSTSSSKATLQLNPAVAAATLGASKSSVDFGSITVGQTSSQSLTLTAGPAPIVISSITVAGSLFGANGVTVPVTIAAGQTANLNVTFAPLQPSVGYSYTGTVTIVSNAPTLTINLAGAGVQAPVLVPTLAASSTSIGFGNVNVGDTATKTLTLSSTGTGPVSITDTPLTMNARQYTVYLHWAAPTPNDTPVSGYNVYRSVSGANSFTKVASLSATQLNYADSAPKNGISYDYQVTSQGTSQDGILRESTPSNTTTVVVPSL